MRALVVVSLDVPDADAMPEVLKHMNPRDIPYFSGEVRVIVDSDVVDVLAFLDEGWSWATPF